MKAYPAVLGELDTLRRIVAGASIARYGDGEFKIATGNGASIKSQPYDVRLSLRLREILLDSGACMVGIPNILSDTPKQEFWHKYLAYASMLDGSRRYVSSFITRPDSAPWIDTDEYWTLLESLWAGQDVVLVRGSGKSLVGDDLTSAGRLTEIIAPRQGAWADYGSLMQRVLSQKPKRVLICLGPTATVMASDLCAKGIHAIDLGHVGMFLRKHVRGEAMWLSKDDKTPEVPV
jgi:hypothetical protein